MWGRIFGRAGAAPEIFVVCGGRRTGTTLLTAILCSDPRTNPLGPEFQILTRLVETYRWGRQNFSSFGSAFFEDLEAYRRFFADTVDRLLQDVAARVSTGGALVVKNPELSLVLLDLVELLPGGANLLATVRDPRDQVASELEVGVRQIEAGMSNPAAAIRDVAALARGYLAYNAELRELYRRRPDDIYLVRYEDLTMRPDETLAGLRAATGLSLPFDPTQRWTNVTPEAALHSGPSRSDLYGEPISTGPVGRFARDLTPEEISIVEAETADFMNELGYACHRPGH